jgi:hypothetical protein
VVFSPYIVCGKTEKNEKSGACDTHEGKQKTHRILIVKLHAVPSISSSVIGIKQ